MIGCEEQNRYFRELLKISHLRFEPTFRPTLQITSISLNLFNYQTDTTQLSTYTIHTTYQKYTILII